MEDKIDLKAKYGWIRFIYYPISFIIVLKMLCTKRTYYLSGTGISNITGERMWFKMCFITRGNLLPIKSIEDKIKKELNFKTCIIVYFNRIPNSMQKYIDKDFDIEIKNIKNPDN